MPDSLGRFRVREAAERLGVHENTIRNWAEWGLLRVERLPGSGFIRVPVEEIERAEAEILSWE